MATSSTTRPGSHEPLETIFNELIDCSLVVNDDMTRDRRQRYKTSQSPGFSHGSIASYSSENGRLTPETGQTDIRIDEDFFLPNHADFTNRLWPSAELVYDDLISEHDVLVLNADDPWNGWPQVELYGQYTAPSFTVYQEHHDEPASIPGHRQYAASAVVVDQGQYATSAIVLNQQRNATTMFQLDHATPRFQLDQQRHTTSMSAHDQRQHLISTAVLPQRTQRLLIPAQGPGSRLIGRPPRQGVRRNRFEPEKKERVSKMRKVGACWRCCLQRDTCPGEDGEECKRCIRARQLDNPPMYFLPCDRSKLPYFIHDFLPVSMSFVHQKQSIEDTVLGEVVFCKSRSFNISLTAGFGPALMWKVMEFIPKSSELLMQYQYFQDSVTRQMIRHEKWSPPYCLPGLNREEQSLEGYLDMLLNPQSPYLHEFAELSYVAESRHDKFQENTLTLLCNLYICTGDKELKSMLRKILRMLILTYIMGHTLTITEDTLSQTLDNLDHSPVPQDVYFMTHVSPRLANRQLKFYFSVMRESIIKELLRSGQNTLRASGQKDQSWLPIFCVMLGFAMVLEEIQGVLAIQAIGKAAKREKSWSEAQTEAINACGRIDERFDLLIALFQHKYRSDKWTSPGSFGNQTPTLLDHASVVFLRDLRQSIEEKEHFLRRRSEVSLGDEHQCDYTTRLVARFLLPFIGLPV